MKHRDVGKQLEGSGCYHTRDGLNDIDNILGFVTFERRIG